MRRAQPRPCMGNGVWRKGIDTSRRGERMECGVQVLNDEKRRERFLAKIAFFLLYAFSRIAPGARFQIHIKREKFDFLFF